MARFRSAPPISSDSRLEGGQLENERRFRASLEQELNRVRQRIDALSRELSGFSGELVTKGEEVSGTGNVWTDVNAYCFIGVWSDGACRMCISNSDLVYIGHNGSLYLYVGPKEVCIGSGGSGGIYPYRVTVQSDYIRTGTSSHTALSDRGATDSHPQSAITDLVADQSAQDSSITGLQQWDADHIAALDPHPQYLLPEELPQLAVNYLSAALHPDWPTEYSMIRTRPTNPSAALQTTVNGDDVLCGNFVRDPALPNDVIYAELETRVVLDLGGESRDTFVYVTASIQENGGGITLLGTSAPVLLDANRATYVFVIQILGPITANAGDWTFVSVYGTKSGGGTARTVTVYVDGNGDSRVVTYLPIPAYPAEHAPSHLPNGSDPITELANFSFAAYARLIAPVNSPFPDLDITWQKIDILTAADSLVPRGITVDRPNSTLAFDNEGVYSMAMSGSLEHDSSNSGRITYLRLYNETVGAAFGDGIALGTGRNAESTPLSVTFLVNVGAADEGNILRFDLGNGDVYSLVEFQTCVVSVNAEGEWRKFPP